MEFSSKTRRALLVGVLIGGLLLHFRWLSLPFLIIAIATSYFCHTRSLEKWKLIAWSSVLVSLILPVDIDPFNLRMHSGESQQGLRLVRLVHGLPKHVTLLEKYGEYFDGGCITPTLPARWILTWREYPHVGLTLAEIRELLDDRPE